MRKLFITAAVIFGIVAACHDEPIGVRTLNNGPLFSSITWTIYSYTADSFCAAVRGGCVDPVSGGIDAGPLVWRPVPARFRWKCGDAGSWNPWSLADAGTGVWTASCVAGTTSIVVEAGLNDSLSASGNGHARIVVDTGQGTAVARVEYNDAHGTSLTFSSTQLKDTVPWQQAPAVAYIVLHDEARRVEAFGYNTPQVAVRVCRYDGTTCYNGNVSFVSGAPDTVRLLADVENAIGGTTHHEDWVNYYSVNYGYRVLYVNLYPIQHEFGHVYQDAALGSLNGDYACHSNCSGVADYVEEFANLVGIFTTGQFTLGHGSPTTPAEGEAFSNFDDWNFDRDTSRVADTSWENSLNLTSEWATTGFLYNLIDAAADSNAYSDTTGDGAGVDNESIHYPASYLGQLLKDGNCKVTYSASARDPGTHNHPKDLVDLMICMENDTTQRQGLPTQYQGPWVNLNYVTGWTVSSNVVRPAGWDSTKVRQLMRWAIYGIGTPP